MNSLQEIKNEVLELLGNKLAPSLHFHSLDHTKLVYLNVQEIINNIEINQIDCYLVKVAALFHDTGFLKVYSGHEEESCLIAQERLPKYGFNIEDIFKICGMIMATKIPQSPKTILEKILCDADLMYLGTSQFKDIGDKLHLELNETFGEMTLKDWDSIQVRFLENHHFHTSYCIEKYSPVKQKNLENLIKLYN